MSVILFITYNLIANAIADTLNLYTIAYIDKHLLNRYYKSTIATIGLLLLLVEVVFRTIIIV
jgi:hypothetical protein